MRRKVVAGNWKMNKRLDEAVALAEALLTVEVPAGTDVILGVPHVFLDRVVKLTEASSIMVAAQNCHAADGGAYTGEVSVPMLTSVGIDAVILGHSERRAQFGEDESLLADKVNAVLAGGLTPIFCCGEPLSVREAEGQNAFVEAQISGSLFGLTDEQMAKIIVAYEPIWAIGTGVTASPEQAQDMHHAIRTMIRARFGDQIADNLSILYGGSVKPANAGELFSQPDVDGGLVGGASLKAQDFSDIIAASA
ncbi:MAG: triose-phosphate isomerase [Saprospiraceae bacterium]|nr:triose-phosphate isomerase [Saprospiraceae bacterium]